MAETLVGSIAEMSLLKILKFLNSEKMNGRLMVTNNYERGEIYVKSGQIIHSVAGSNIGESALYNMLGWIEGHFSFENDVQAPEKSIETSTEQLLLEGARMTEDWQSIKKVVSSMNIVFALSASSSTGAVNLQPDEWQILAQVNGNRTVAEIVEATGKDEFEVAKILFQLHSSGLLEKKDKPAKAVSAIIDEAFFNKIEEELTKVIGPMAMLIIEEAIEELGETRSAFPDDKIAALVEKISNEIDEENKKLLFSQIMIESLKKL